MYLSPISVRRVCRWFWCATQGGSQTRHETLWLVHHGPLKKRDPNEARHERQGYTRGSKARRVFPSTFSLLPCLRFPRQECTADINKYPRQECKPRIRNYIILADRANFVLPKMYPPQMIMQCYKRWSCVYSVSKSSAGCSKVCRNDCPRRSIQSGHMVAKRAVKPLLSTITCLMKRGALQLPILFPNILQC